MLRDEAEVYGDAVLLNSVVCSDKVKIMGDVKIGGRAEFSGDTIIKSDNDWVHIENAIIENQRMTFYKIANDIYCNCNYIKDDTDEYIHLTLDKLVDYLRNNNIDNDIIKKYESCFNYIKSRLA